MDTPIAELEAIGKQTFEQAFQMGQFFFPKVVWKHLDRRQFNIAMYETEFEAFVRVCEMTATRPLEFLAHTTDSYYFNAKADPETTKRIQAGETSAREQFEEENPNASEALIIMVIDALGRFEHRTLPYKRQGKTLRWSDPVVLPEGIQPSGRYADVMAATIKASYDVVDENAGG